MTDEERQKLRMDCYQFGTQSDAVAWPDIDAAVKAGLATRNPAPNAAPSAYSNWKTVITDGTTASPRPDASAGLIQASILLDNRADEYTGYNEKIEQGYRMAAKYLRVRAADRSGK